MTIEIRPGRNSDLQRQPSKGFMKRTQMVSKSSRFNFSIRTRTTVVKVPPKMAKVNF